MYNKRVIYDIDVIVLRADNVKVIEMKINKNVQNSNNSGAPVPVRNRYL